MPKDNEIQKTKLLIVEGNHERDFFNAWFFHLGISDIQVMPIGGKTKLAVNLKALIKQTNYISVVSIVIVRDADDNPAGAFQSICSALENARLPVPPVGEKFIIRDGLKLAVVITPGNDRSGALEELLLETTIADPLSSHAAIYIDQAVANLNENHDRPAPLAHKHGKAKIHAFLATFEEPDKDPGKAALSGVWDFNHTALFPIRTILEQM
jgi:hypothetical protein